MCQVCIAISVLRPDPDANLIAMNRPAESIQEPQRGAGVAERLYTTPITSQLVDQRLEHQVTDGAVAAGRNAHRYQALCGQLFVAAPLVAPPGRPCPACAAILAAASRAAAPAAAHQPRQRRRGLLRRLLNRADLACTCERPDDESIR